MTTQVQERGARLEIVAGTLWSPRVFVRVLRDLTGNEDLDKNYGHIPVGHVCVVDEWRTDAKWQLVGADSYFGSDDDPVEVARRCISIKTGIEVEVSAFTYFGRENRPGNARMSRLYFTCDVRWSALKTLRPYKPEERAERVAFFTVNTFKTLLREERFLRAHYDRMLEFNMVLPF